MSGRQVTLRSPRQGDFKLISDWIAVGSAGAAYTGDIGQGVAPEQLADLQRSGQVNYLMIQTEAEGVVGAVNWGHRGHSRAYSIAIIIGESRHWQVGYGAVAFLRLLDHMFQSLDAWRVEITTAAYNPHTVPAFARRRLTLEGILRDYFYLDGEYHDATVWSVLRPEYFRSVAEGQTTDVVPYEPLIPVEAKTRAKGELRRYLQESPNVSWLT